MDPGDMLAPGQSIKSANGQFAFTLQPDGNLILYDAGRALWASQTSGKHVVVCSMQMDGNLVVYLSNYVVCRTTATSSFIRSAGARGSRQ